MISRPRRFLEIVLLIIGVTGLGIWGWSVVRENVYEDWNNWAFDQQTHHQEVSLQAWISDHLHGAQTPPLQNQASSREVPAEPAPSSALPAQSLPAQPKDTNLLGRLRIPRLSLQAIVREGTADKTLSISLGHILGTAKPGQNGNVGVAGHRDSLFRGLRNIRLNDQIVFDTSSGETYTYQVTSTQIVKPTQVSVLNAGKYPELTLVTCYPFNYIGSAPDRFIVHARQIAQVTRGLQTEIAKSEAPRVPAPAEGTPKPEPVQNSAKGSETVTVRSTPKIYQKAAHAVPFELTPNHSRQLAPGISIGLNRTDPQSKTMDGWMWVMPDRRTIWLRDQSAHRPIVIYTSDGRRRELVIDSISRNAVRGYLVL